MDRKFNIQEYLRKNMVPEEGREVSAEFKNVLDIVEGEFEKEWLMTKDEVKTRKLEREKRAMMGFQEETCYYKEKIKDIIRNRKLENVSYPEWFPDLTEAVFAELYGLSGLEPWAYDSTEEYRNSSSAKLIGDRLYCLIDGKTRLQPQRINRRRREQLKRTLLLATPKERVSSGFHEVYLHNGIRITIYSGERTKNDQDIMVFRKYILKDYTFEKLVELRTIPRGAPRLFKMMVGLGCNMIFSGEVRSGKTTFLQTWQSYEDQSLEGVAVSTDPETPWHKIMPLAPIMQIVADGKALESVMKSLLRGDNDYIILEEMRDGAAFRLALDITSSGTIRSKVTVHDRNAVNIPYKMAARICDTYGGDINERIAQVYKNFDYVIECCQDSRNRGRKIMKGIVEFHYDEENDVVRAVRICEYDSDDQVWRWNSAVEPSKAKKFSNQEGFREFQCMLKLLEEEEPMEERNALYPSYYRSSGRRRVWNK